jgi:hypothetical protein
LVQDIIKAYEIYEKQETENSWYGNTYR